MITELDGKKLSAPNDLAIDNNDNIWFSDQIGNVDALGIATANKLSKKK